MQRILKESAVEMHKPSDYNNTLEIERTFLAVSLPDEINLVEATYMEDAYIPEELSVHPKTRVRRRGDRFELTKKIPFPSGNSLIHEEKTIQLDENEYHCLSAASQRSIQKLRYTVSIDGYKAEVDVFKGRLEGLVLIDFEFNETSSSEEFAVPDCCLVEVTNRETFAGGMLSGKCFADIEAELSALGYSAI